MDSTIFYVLHVIKAIVKFENVLRLGSRIWLWKFKRSHESFSYQQLHMEPFLCYQLSDFLNSTFLESEWYIHLYTRQT